MTPARAMCSEREPIFSWKVTFANLATRSSILSFWSSRQKNSPSSRRATKTFSFPRITFSKCSALPLRTEMKFGLSLPSRSRTTKYRWCVSIDVTKTSSGTSKYLVSKLPMKAVGYSTKFKTSFKSPSSI